MLIEIATIIGLNVMLFGTIWLVAKGFEQFYEKLSDWVLNDKS